MWGVRFEALTERVSENLKRVRVDGIIDREIENKRTEEKLYYFFSLFSMFSFFIT